MDTYSTINVNPLQNGFGARITGLDLSRPLPKKQLEEIRRAWIKHSVIFFPDQPLDHTGLEAFTLQFGEFGFDPFIKAMPDHPHILELRREANERAVNFGAAWHSDWSFQECPPSATILHSKVVPPVGGDTLFADCYRAYEDLSSVMRNFLDGLTAIHSAAYPYGRNGLFAQEKEQRSMQIVVSEEAEKTWEHPLVRTHPESGRKALYVSPAYTVGIKSLAKDESDHILSFLYAHATREEYVYRHKWQANMLTMWDNRCTLHNADGGYDGHQRIMHRTTVAGEAPV